MNRALVVSLTVALAGPGVCRAQFGGNAVSAQGGGKARAEQAERQKRTVTRDEQPPSPTAAFVEANVLMNVKADEYVAVFGVAREAETVAECARKMDATVREFTEALKPLGLAGDDVFVDFVTQTRTYGFQVEGDVAREKPVGFELKKNVSVRFTDRSLLDRLVQVAARSEVFDLIKVDYHVKDTRAVRERLGEEAAAVVKRKTVQYENLLGVALKPPAQVYADRVATYYPSGLYDQYTAFASESIDAGVDRRNLMVQSARKSQTFYFNGLDGSGFDEVVNPVVVEPVVQFTLYLKVKYEVEQPRAR